MKNIITLLLLICSISLSAIEVDVMTFNIRYDEPSDGENNWQYRKDNVASLINFYEADVIGLQEALKNQIEDLEVMMPNYKWTGIGRDDGGKSGEFCPIFFNTKKFSLVETGTFWLSKEDAVPGSIGWDASITRICTWAKLKNRLGVEFFVFNTHFDHKGKQARLESAKLILKKIPEIAGNAPVIFLGDLNCDANSKPYDALTKENDQFFLLDAKKISKAEHHGPESTISRFKSAGVNDIRMNFIMVQNRVFVLKHATLSDSWEGKFPSDHLPVMARVSFVGTVPVNKFPMR